MALAPDRDIAIELVTTRKQRDTFVRLPWRIYQGDPHWVPPLIKERKDFINPRRHPFYRHGEAAQWLARRGADVVGRIQASDDPRYNAQHGLNVGSFGLFESIDNAWVTARLLDTAAEWLVQRGRTGLIGPIDYSTNYACGLLIDGFDTPPRVMMNHNPPHYARLLEHWGLTKAKDIYCWWFTDALDLAQRWQRRARRLATRGHITIRPLNLRDLANELAIVKAIYNEAWSNNWGFVQPSEAELGHFTKLLADLAVPEMLLLAEVDGTPAGIALTLPDANMALAEINGRLTRWGLPSGYLKLCAALKRVTVCRLLMLGVVEKYRRRGVTELLILHTLEYGKKVAGYQNAELSWTLEDNRAINRAIEAAGGCRYKTYRIYQRRIGP